MCVLHSLCIWNIEGHSCAGNELKLFVVYVIIVITIIMLKSIILRVRVYGPYLEAREGHRRKR